MMMTKTLAFAGCGERHIRRLEPWNVVREFVPQLVSKAICRTQQHVVVDRNLDIEVEAMADPAAPGVHHLLDPIHMAAA